MIKWARLSADHVDVAWCSCSISCWSELPKIRFDGSPNPVPKATDPGPTRGSTDLAEAFQNHETHKSYNPCRLLPLYADAVDPG